LSGKLAAMALYDRIEVTAMVGPAPIPFGSDPVDLTGKPAHSHAFLPRFIRDVEAVVPQLSTAFERAGLQRVAASRAFRNPAPFQATRLRAMRWQVEDVVTDTFNQRLGDRLISATVSSARIDGHLNELTLHDGRTLALDPGTLVVDATGARSPLMRLIAGLPGAPVVEDEPSHIGYVTQIFRLKQPGASAWLPDTVLDCAEHLGPAFVTLYEGADGWFSVTLAWDMRDRATTDHLHDTASVIALAGQSAGVERWIAAARPAGPARRYLNPRNRWSPPLLAWEGCPANYVSIGDALVTTAPTLGAGCSWLASHVRLLAESLAAGSGWRKQLLDAITAEQRAFFDQSVAVGAPQRIDPPPQRKLLSGPVRAFFAPYLDRKRRAQVRANIISTSTL
jgi:2-polyprenyl-6-methoxyphenol hydroxylase-like FAD-dependent oxidoreductase